jgi:hypothetical protein
MTQTLKLSLKSTLLSKEKILLIDPEFIEFDNTNFSKFEIAELRYGIKAIKGYRFVIGRIYCIDIKTLDEKIIKIRLKSLYRVRKHKLGEKYKIILKALFENFINDICQSFIDKFNNKVDFNLLGTTFTQNGVILNKTTETIPWFDLGTRNYWSYYSLFSITDSRKYRIFYYLSDWNTIVLYSVSRHILKLKNHYKK